MKYCFILSTVLACIASFSSLVAQVHRVDRQQAKSLDVSLNAKATAEWQPYRSREGSTPAQIDRARRLLEQIRVVWTLDHSHLRTRVHVRLYNPLHEEISLGSRQNFIRGLEVVYPTVSVTLSGRDGSRQLFPQLIAQGTMRMRLPAEGYADMVFTIKPILSDVMQSDWSTASLSIEVSELRLGDTLLRGDIWDLTSSLSKEQILGEGGLREVQILDVVESRDRYQDGSEARFLIVRARDVAAKDGGELSFLVDDPSVDLKAGDVVAIRATPSRPREASLIGKGKSIPIVIASRAEMPDAP